MFNLAERLLSNGRATSRNCPLRSATRADVSSFRSTRAHHPPSSKLFCRSISNEASSVSAPVITEVNGTSGNRLPASGKDELVKTRFIAETLLPTKHGKFRLRGYKHSVDGGTTFTEPTAIICGVVEGQSNVAVRVHDACFTSEVLGSLKCDCAEQLQLALDYIQQQQPGIVIYLQQEGRGIGLANKIAAYQLQEQGLDTVDANRALGLPDDCREYTSVRNILRDLHVQSIQLMTNNPRKINTLTSLGIPVTGRIPCQVQAGKYNQGYLAAKRDRMDHLLDGSWCFWNHDGEPTQPTATAHSRGGMDLPSGLKRGLIQQHNSSSSSSGGSSSIGGDLSSAGSSSSSSIPFPGPHTVDEDSDQDMDQEQQVQQQQEQAKASQAQQRPQALGQWS